MNTENLFPIEWTSWDPIDTLLLSFYDVKFTEDFGVFKKGESFSSISVDYGKGIIEAYNDEGTEVIKTQKYSTTPIN